MTMTGKIVAPWTADQVDALNRFQRAGCFHPFTCPGHEGVGDRVLVATSAGWICPHCDYKQDWAHAVMFEAPIDPPCEIEPIAWIVLSEETGNTRIWWRDKERAEAWAAKHQKELIPLYAAPSNMISARDAQAFEVAFEVHRQANLYLQTVQKIASVREQRLAELVEENRKAREALDIHGYAPTEGQSLAAAIDTALSALIHEREELRNKVEDMRKSRMEECELVRAEAKALVQSTERQP